MVCALHRMWVGLWPPGVGDSCSHRGLGAYHNGDGRTVQAGEGQRKGRWLCPPSWVESFHTVSGAVLCGWWLWPPGDSVHQRG
jgi:hypothetical protein